MAQNSLNLANPKGQEVIILSTTDGTKNAATILKTYLDQAFEYPFLIQIENKKNNGNAKIILKIEENTFVIKSDEKNIELIGSDEKTVRYAVYTLLETFGFRKYTAKDNFIPNLKQVAFPKNSNQTYKPFFEYRA
ncbi:hypothetical protein [Flavobacterium laiguense]|uniref:Beta-hexosaminidase bacterial type N-terminal domain-containing protein n=1 Tax=Flavobacterium laiguense TaxID=2169409 RepID=A0A2U1JWX3_9FLAO|nr:hypothetical protein [Flavobacterium laiguense]PWA09333.1 hypothetical protein DB891_08590 [Flavobacterium laiguense]